MGDAAGPYVLIFMVRKRDGRVVVVVVRKEWSVKWVDNLGFNGRDVIESCGVGISGVCIVGGVGIVEVIKRDDVVEVIERDDVVCDGVKMMDGERRHGWVFFVGSLIFVRGLIFSGVRIVRGVVVGFVGWGCLGRMSGGGSEGP
jgi:hypothetical protein